MRKKSLLSIVMLFVSFSTFAGGLLTNTNQHPAFLRMLSRGATTDIDAALSNPAGLAFLPKDGFYATLSVQNAFQTRNIDATSPLWTMDGNNTSRYYEGEASAPVIPSVFVAWKKGDWTLSSFFAITGGGGKASFDQGLPMFDALTNTGIGAVAGLTPDKFEVNSAMDGKQYIYALQMGITYKVNDWLSAFAGGRMNYYTGGYEGFLNAKTIPTLGGKSLVNMALDCEQSGWGLTPVIGADVKLGKLTIGAKYEFMTNLNLENKTDKAEFGMNVDPATLTPEQLAALGQVATVAEGALEAYKDGNKNPSDIPAMLSIAVAYEFIPVLRASVEYHFYDDKNANMADNKQDYLTKGTNEWLAGIEWDATKYLTLSCGGQITDYGLSDEFQSNTSFSCDSYSLGFGAKIRVTERAEVNVGYMWTNYEDYTVNQDALIQGKTVYSRTNKVFGLSLGYRF